MNDLTKWRDYQSVDELDRLLAAVLRLPRDLPWTRDIDLVIELVEGRRRPVVRYWNIAYVGRQSYRAEVNNIHYFDRDDERGVPQRCVSGTQGFGWGETPQQALAEALIDWKLRVRADREDKE